MSIQNAQIALLASAPAVALNSAQPSQSVIRIRVTVSTSDAVYLGASGVTATTGYKMTGNTGGSYEEIIILPANEILYAFSPTNLTAFVLVTDAS